MVNNEDNDWFFDRFERQAENMLNSPSKTFFKFGVIALILNLIFWGAIIFGIAWAVSVFV